MKQKVLLSLSLLFILFFSKTFAIPVPESDGVNSESSDDNGRKIPFRCLIPCDRTGNDPICATDGRDYTSPKELICYQMCGKNIQVAYYGKCKGSTNFTSPL